MVSRLLFLLALFCQRPMCNPGKNISSEAKRTYGSMKEVVVSGFFPKCLEQPSWPLQSTVLYHFQLWSITFNYVFEKYFNYKLFIRNCVIAQENLIFFGMQLNEGRCDNVLTCEGSTLQSLKVVEDHTRKEAPACRTMRSITESNQEKPFPNVRKNTRILCAFGLCF